MVELWDRQASFSRGLLLRSLVMSSLAALLLTTPVSAQVTSQQRRELSSIRTVLRKAENLAKRRDLKGAGDAVREAKTRFDAIMKDANPQLKRQAKSTFESLQRMYAQLEFEGVKLPPLKAMEPDGTPMPDTPAPGTPAPGTPAPTPTGAVSFKAHVAPILIAKCGRCHVNNARGMLSMANYAALMKGTPDGTVIQPPDDEASRFIEVIASGDMPRGGLKVAATELATLKKWIKEGAKYDGGDPAASLATLAPNATAQAPPTVEAKMSTGKETVSFANDIAPVLVEHCAGCHGNGRRPSSGFDLTTMRTLFRGGDSGPPVQPGKPDDSLLIQKLRGTATGERMPRGRPALSDKTIATVAKWIEEGATFDGPDITMNVGDVAAIAKAKRSTHEELAAERAAIAERNWKLGMPSVPLNRVETEHFLVVGGSGESVLREIADAAEAVVPRIVKMFRAASDKPLVKGKTTIFVLNQRYDYTEFGKMVERRALPRSLRGHYRYSIIDAYAAVLPPRKDEYSLDGLLAQQIAGVYVSNLGQGKVPRWFAEGSARVAAARVDAKDARIAAWDGELAEILVTMGKPDDFINSKLSPQQNDIASYSFVKFLMTDPKRYGRLLDAIGEQQDFAQSFVAIYGMEIPQATELWAARSRRSR